MHQVKHMKGSFMGLPQRAQAVIVVVALATLIVLALLVRATTATEWVTVAEVPVEKAASAQTALTEAKIKTQVAGSGTIIQVPAAQESQARMKLAENNITGASHTSCEEIYAKSGTFGGSTSAQQKVNARQCLENSLANDIQSLSAVDRASVRLNMPEPALFSGEEQAASAAITVSTGGNSLEAKQVKAISRLVAGAVPNLQASNVTVVDEEGQLLTTDAGESGGGVLTEAQAKLQLEAQYNRAQEAKWLEEFESIAGDGKVKVIFNAELDMNQVTEEVKNYGSEENPDGLAAEERTEIERLGSAATAPAGVAGTGSNVNNMYAGREETAGSGVSGPVSDLEAIEGNDDIPEETKEDLRGAIADRYRAQSEQQPYEAEKRQVVFNHDEFARATKIAPGAVSRNRVALIVDESVPEEARTALRTSAQSLIGLRPDVDSFNYSVAPLPAADEELQKQLEAAERQKMLMAYARWALLGLGLIILAFVLRRTLNQRTEELLNPGDEILMLEAGMEPIPLKELEAAVSAASSLESQKRLELQKRVETIVDSKPEDVAQQLRGWLHDSDRR